MSNNQRGVVLVIALIMLAVVTLIGTVSANIVMGNLRVVQNIEARAAANAAHAADKAKPVRPVVVCAMALQRVAYIVVLDVVATMSYSAILPDLGVVDFE